MRLEFKNRTSKKYWEAEVLGSTLLVRWGRLGTKGQEKLTRFKTPALAEAAGSEQRWAKQRKGYEPVVAAKPAKGRSKTKSVEPAPALARNADLEATIAERPDDPTRHLVYADWLQSNGNPWGELITVQDALARKPRNAGLQKREVQLLKGLGLPDVNLARCTWNRGVLQAVHLRNELDWEDDEFDALGLARRVFDLPQCFALEELRLGILRWNGNHKDVPAVLNEASTRPFAARLKRLFLGDVPDDIDMAHHVVGDVKMISKAFPALEWLKIHSGRQTWRGGGETFALGTFVLPKCRELIIETCSMSKKLLGAVTAGQLPALERLELWFGSRDQGANCNVIDVAPILEGSRTPKLVHLALRNAEFESDIAKVLPKGRIAPRLESLDLSMGTMDDDGAQALAAGAKAFPKLARLDVSDNFLSKAAVSALKKAFPGVKVISTEQKEADADEPEWRYVTVGE